MTLWESDQPLYVGVCRGTTSSRDQMMSISAPVLQVPHLFGRERLRHLLNLCRDGFLTPATVLRSPDLVEQKICGIGMDWHGLAKYCRIM